MRISTGVADRAPSPAPAQTRAGLALAPSLGLRFFCRWCLFLSGVVSCLHHRQRPAISLPAFRFFSCRHSLHFYRDIFSLNPVVCQSPLASHRDGCVTWPCRSFLVWFQLPALCLPVLWGGHSPSLCFCTRLSSCRAPIRLPAPRGQPLCDAFCAVLGLTPSASNVNSAKRHSNTGTYRVDLCFTSPRCEPVSPFSGPGLCLIYLCVPSTRPYVESAPWMFAEWT